MNKRTRHVSGIHLFKLLGFDVNVDVSWFFLAFLVTWSLAIGYYPEYYPGISNNTYWIMGIISAIGLFFSIVLHELSHSLVGRHFGIPFKGITLFIFGGVAQMGEMPSSPKAEGLMAVVGPLFSVSFGLLLYIFYLLAIDNHWSIAIIGVLGYLSMINVMVAIFNSLPGFPLDGGRVLRSMLWWWSNDVQWATAIAYRSGFVLYTLMIIFGIFLFIQGLFVAGLWLFILGLFLQRIAKVSYQEIILRELFGNETIKKLAATQVISVPPNLGLQELVNHYFYHHYHKLYPVIDGKKLLGYVTFNTVKPIAKEEWSRLTIRDIMQPCDEDIMIDSSTSVVDALKIMAENRQTRMLVMENNELYGIITMKDIIHAFSVRMDLDDH